MAKEYGSHIAVCHTVRPRSLWLKQFLLSSSILGGVSTSAVHPACAQQVVANGTTQSATVNINTGILSPTLGYALYALNAGTINGASGLQFTTGGNTAHGGLATGAGSTINIGNSSSVRATGTQARGLFATSNGQINIGSGTTVTTTGSSGYGLSATVKGVITTSGPVNVITQNASGHGVDAESGGQITLASGSTVETFGNGAYGMLATGRAPDGTASTITATNTIVTQHAGSSFQAVYAQAGGVINLTGGSVTAGPGNSGLFAFGSSATVISTINATDVTVNTSGTNGSGIQANNFSNVTVTRGSVATTGTNNYGLYTIGPGSNLTANGTVVQTSGDTANGAYALQGIMGLTNVLITTTGNGASGALVDNASQLTITGGAITTSGTTSTVTGSSTFGLLSLQRSTLTANGAVVTTHGDSSPGAAAQLGAILNLNGGSIKTTGNSSVGLFSVGFSGATPASLTADAVSVTTSGTNSHGAVVRGGSSITIKNGSNVSTTGAGAAALLSSAFDLNPSIATITNSTLTSAQSDGIRTNGTTLNALFTGSTLSGGGSLLNTINGGILNLIADSSTLTGAALTDTATNSVSNVTLRNGTTWGMTGSSNMTSLTNNGSTINFTPPIGDPTQLASYKVLTTNNYIGAGGTIAFNTYLGTDGSPSDLLIINTGSAIGTTALRITNAGGAGALTTGNGILVVDTINNGTTGAGVFSLAGPVAAGPYDYTLFRSSVDAANSNAWYLRSTLDCALDPTAPACQDNPPSPPPNYRPETSLYPALPAMALLYGRSLVDTLHERVGEEEDIRGRKDLHKDAPYTGGWVRAIGVHGQQDSSRLGSVDGSPQYNYNFFGIQGGQDLSRREHADGSRDHLGAMFAVGGANGTVTHTDGTTGKNSFAAYSFGGYWTHFGPQGWYLDTVAFGTYYDMASSANRGIAGLSPRGMGLTTSAEVGRPIRFDNGYFIEPQAQVIYQFVNLADTSDGAALVNFKNAESLAGRVGARFGRSWNIDGTPNGRQLTVWLRPNFWYEFMGNPVTLFSSADGPVPFQSTLRGAWGEINAGISGQINAQTTLFANASYNERFDGRASSYNGKAGIRINW